jgi:DNA-directed RNA polymerase sigma subunit (sigma70/sigma32)
MVKKVDRVVEDPAMTHQEIADVFGVSRAAVADMEKKALRKLKKVLEKNGYTIEDFFGVTRKK